jgi:hypothetical protein
LSKEQITTTKKEHKTSLSETNHDYVGNKKLGHRTNKEYTVKKSLVQGTNHDYIEGTKKIRPQKEIKIYMGLILLFRETNHDYKRKKKKWRQRNKSLRQREQNVRPQNK